MAYCDTNGVRVFLSRKRWEAIRSVALADRDPIFRVKSMMAGTHESYEAHSLMIGYLESEWRRDPVEFLQKWVEFRVYGDEASQEVWELFHDRTLAFADMQIIDLRNDLQQLFGDRITDSLTYPQGTVFAVEFLGPRRWWHRFFNRRPLMRIVIDTAAVRRLSGDLTAFTIWSPDYTLIVADTVVFESRGFRVVLDGIPTVEVLPTDVESAVTNG